MSRIALALAAVLLALTSAGCGNKGPLYLPQGSAGQEPPSADERAE